MEYGKTSGISEVKTRDTGNFWDRFSKTTGSLNL
jgi:hypothetical protein